LQLPGKPQKIADTGKLSGDELLNGRYVPTRKLAQGGQGAIYQVTDTQNGGVTYALKGNRSAPFSRRGDVNGYIGGWS